MSIIDVKEFPKRFRTSKFEKEISEALERVKANPSGKFCIQNPGPGFGPAIRARAKALGLKIRISKFGEDFYVTGK